jgi:hypothetical protein
MAQGKKQESSGTQYRYVGDHAEILDSGAPVGVGEYVTLTDEQAEGQVAKALIEAGRLIDASDFKVPDETEADTSTAGDPAASAETETKQEGSGE